MPKGKKFEDQKELGEYDVEEKAIPGKPDSRSVGVVAPGSEKQDRAILALIKEPFIAVGDEFEVPELGKIKVMDLAYHSIIKVPGPPTVDGKPTFEEKIVRERCTSTGDIEPDFLPEVEVSYKIPGTGLREPDVHKQVGLAEFYKLVKIKE